MSLCLHDTLRGHVAPLVTDEPNHVRLYVCGPTVYDHAHVGHIRSALTYDVLVRHLRESGKRVTYVRNVTDVDDKIIRRAQERNESPVELAKRYEDTYRSDVRALGLIDPDFEPRVSEHIDDIQALIAKLIERGCAYASDGDVYFSVEAFPEYGKLSHRKLEHLSLGASGRLDEQEQRRKRHPADFALWKGGTDEGASWDSPWGRGRPGWHIECSAMAMRYLGETMDVHGGGLDLVFPHHENELAQSEGATGKPFTRAWVHHGFIETSKEKMSKSLGNFLTARESFAIGEPEALRYLLMTAHYRAPLGVEWVRDEQGVAIGFPQLDEAERRVEYIHRTRARLTATDPARLADGEVPEPIAQLGARLTAALDDDLNTPIALAALAEFLKQVNELTERAKGKTKISRQAVEAAHKGFELIGRLLGLGVAESGALLERVRARRSKQLGIDPTTIEQKLIARVEARKAKDFARADALRDEIAALGIELMDGPEGTTWRIP